MICKITLAENEIPDKWYNIVADMPNKSLPPLNPGTLEPIGPKVTYGIATAINEAEICKKEGKSKTILMNLCGYGNYDMKAYEDYFAGKIVKHELSDEEIKNSIEKLQTSTIP